MYRLLQHRSLTKVEERSVFNESCVQRRKRVSLCIQVTAKMRFDSCGISLEFFPQTADLHASGQFAQRREFAAEVSIDKDQPTGCAGKRPRFQIFLPYSA